MNAALQSIVHSLSQTPPTLWAVAVIGWMWVRCRHRSERPFISSLGRWTPHLISNKGNFSILQPVYSDTATNLGFYYFSSAVSFFLLFWKILLTLTGLYVFPLWTFPPLCRERETAAKSFAFQQRGLWVFVRFFFLDRLSFFVGEEKHGSAIVQDNWKGWNRGWKARRGCCFTHQDQWTGKWYFIIRLLESIRGRICSVLERGCALRAQSVRNCG